MNSSLVLTKLETKKNRPKAAWSSVAVSIHPNLILGRLDARLLEHTGTSVGAFCVDRTYQTLQRMPPRRAAGKLYEILEDLSDCHCIDVAIENLGGLDLITHRDQLVDQLGFLVALFRFR